MLVMKNFFMRMIVICFCFFSFNTYAFESIYLVCTINNETTVFGFVETLRDKFDNLGRTGSLFATGYLANSKINEFAKKTSGVNGISGDASIQSNELKYYDYRIDRVTGQATTEWWECRIDGVKMSSMLCTNDMLVNKSKLIGSCNKASESEAKAKARQIFTPEPEPKRKF